MTAEYTESQVAMIALKEAVQKLREMKYYRNDILFWVKEFYDEEVLG